MEAGDFFFVYIFAGIAVIGFIIYLIKVSKAKKLIGQAEDAHKQGNNAEAVRLFKEALVYGNQKADMEEQILIQLEDIYKKYDKEVDFSDYRKLVEQTRILSKKTSYKAANELKQVLKLKKEIVNKMPSLV